MNKRNGIYALQILFFLTLLCSCVTNHETIKTEQKEQPVHSKVFVESYPPERPQWTQGKPESKEEIYFIGVSNYFGSEAEARDAARKNAYKQVVEYYGTIIQNQSIKQQAVKGLSSEILNPYIEEEELLQSFAERYVTQILPENYYIEKYLIDGSYEQFISYVKCSVSKQKVLQEIEDFAENVSQRYTGLLPEMQPEKYNSMQTAADAYIQIYKTIHKNPIHEAVASIQIKGKKTALAEYARMQAKRIILDCRITAKNKELSIEKGELGRHSFSISSPDYKTIGFLNYKAEITNSSGTIACGYGKLEEGNEIILPINSIHYPCGTYSLTVTLIDNANQDILGIIEGASASALIEIEPIYVGIIFESSGDFIISSKLERDIQNVIQENIEKYAIPLFIDNKKNNSKNWYLTVHLDCTKLASGQNVFKIRTVGTIQFTKNGITHCKSKEFSGTALSKTQEVSLENSIKQSCITIQNDSQFFKSVKEKINI